MYRTKQEVDRHAQEVLRKTKSEDERNIRCFNIAKLYYQVGDYESAKRYVAMYLSKRHVMPGAHKLLANILEALGQKEAALEEYKVSLELDAKQDDLVLKVCELLAHDDICVDVNRARYWVERAEKIFPHHPIVFQLKEKMLTVNKTISDGEDLESLIKSELAVRPSNVQLHVKLLKYYMEKNKLDDAYSNAFTIETSNANRNSVAWYQVLNEIASKYKSKKQSDYSFWIFYVSIAERYAALCIKEQGNVTNKSVQEASQAVINFDQVLNEMINVKLPSNPAFMEHMIDHMRGQLHYHLGCLILRKTKHGNWSTWGDAGRLCLPVFLTALHTTPIDPAAPWAAHLKDSSRNLVQTWNKEGAYRCSQSGHILQDYAKDNVKRLMEKIENFCSSGWRERVFKRVFTTDLYSQISKSFFVQHKAPELRMRLCSQTELQIYDEIAESVWPASLHHQVWLGLCEKNNSQSQKRTAPTPNLSSHIFPELQMSVYNLSQAAPETLRQLDIDAFLNAAILCASASLEAHNYSHIMNPDRFPTLPADLTNSLVTVAQERWWECAYKLYQTKDGVLEDDIGEFRQILQCGLEVVRCIGNHGLSPVILVHLARIFQYRAKKLAEENSDLSDISALEARSELYWSVAVPLLERLLNGQSIRTSNTKLFNYEGKEMTNVELSRAIEEGRLALVQKLLKNGDDEHALEQLRILKSPEAAFEQGKIYKKLADEINEIVSEDVQNQRHTLYLKARNSFYLTLDRLRSPEVDPKHPLNSEIYNYISEIDDELKKVSPDSWINDTNRLEGDQGTDESYSSACSNEEPHHSYANSYSLSNANYSNNGQTPRRNISKPKVASTPRQILSQLETSRLNVSKGEVTRRESRPSPEKLEAQLRQLMSRDNVLQTIVEQNKNLMESNKIISQTLADVMKQLNELKLEVHKKSTDAPKPTATKISTQQNENTEVAREEDYNELYAQAMAAQVIPPVSIAKPPSAYPAVPDYCSPAKYAMMMPALYPALGAYTGYTGANPPPTPHMFPPRMYPQTQSMYPSGLYQPDDLTELLHAEARMLHRMTENIRTGSQTGQFVPQPLEQDISEVNMSTPNVPREVQQTKAPSASVTVASSDVASTTISPVNSTFTAATTPKTTSATTLASAVHNYQISMPLQANIPTTVNLPPLSSTVTTAISNLSNSMSEKSGAHNATTISVGSHNNSDLYPEQEHDPIPDFLPVIPLPAEVTVTTGEENEATLFCARAKLFRFVDKEWKERGVGNVKLLKNKDGKVRLLMRREQVLKICANHFLMQNMELSPMSKTDKAWVWVANDFADEEVKLEKFCIKFKTAAEAQDFKKSFDTARLNLPPPSPHKPEKKMDVKVPETKAEEKPSTQVKVGGFSFVGKPIIQEQVEDKSKIKDKTDEPPKPSPFATFTFSKTDVTSPVTLPLGFTWDKTKSDSAAPPANDTKPNLRLPHLDIQKTEVKIIERNAILRSCTGSNLDIWTENGTGQAVVVKDKPTGGVRILVKKGAKVLCNLPVTKDGSFTQDGKIILCVLKEAGKVKARHSLEFQSIQTGAEFYNGVTYPDKAIEEEKISEVAKQENNANNKPFGERFKPAAGSWECSSCYTRNSAGTIKCVACANPAPSAKLTPSTTPAAMNDTVKSMLSEMLKPAAGSWECISCHIRNNAGASVCLVCSYPAPSAKPAMPSVTPAATKDTTQPSLSEMFKPAAGSWECTSCYTRNNSGVTQCVACTNPAPQATQLSTPVKTDSFQIKGVDLSTTKTFSFGLPADMNKDAKPRAFNFQMPTPGGGDADSGVITGGFTFGMPSQTTVAASKTTASPAIPIISSTPSTQKSANLTFGSPGKSFDFQFHSKSPMKSPGGAVEHSEGEEVEQSEDVYFAPVIPLPDKIDVKTGEENEDILYSHRAKLFRFDATTKEWKERGLGDIKLLRHKDSKKLRLVMRRDQILKLCLNHFVTPDLEITPKDDKTWLWAAADYSDGEIEYHQFACRFKTPEIAGQFKIAVDDSLANVEGAIKPTTEKLNLTTTQKQKEEKQQPPQQDIQILYEVKVTPEEKAEAKKLQLPENFYAYKQKEDCPGCIGCQEPEFELTKSTEKQTEKEKESAKPKSNETEKQKEKEAEKVKEKEKDKENEKKSIFGGGSSATLFDSGLQVKFGTSPFSLKKSSIESKPGEFIFGPAQKESPFSVSKTTDENTTDTSTDTDSTGLDNVKICSPEESAKLVTTGEEAFEKPLFGKQLFRPTPSATPSFGGKSIFDGVPTGGSLFGGNNQTKSDQVSRFSFAAPSKNLFGSPVFGGASATPSTLEKKDGEKTENTVTSSSIGSTPVPSSNIFGSSTPGFGNSGPVIFGNAIIGSGTNIFSGQPKPEEKKEITTSATPTFLLPDNNTVSFSSLAVQGDQTNAFKKDPNFSFDGTGSTVFGIKSTPKSVGLTHKKKDQDESTNAEEEEEDENDAEHDPHFEPIVPLPEMIEVRTGEEDEEKVFGERAKLYRYNADTKEWKERGVGEMKVLHHAARGTYRLLLRREQVHKCVCNFLLSPDTEFMPLHNNERSWMWAGMNYAEEPYAVEKLAIRFKLSDSAVQFKQAVDKAQECLRDKQNQSQDKDNVESDCEHLEYDERVIQEGDPHYQEDCEEEEEEEEDDEEDENILMFEVKATLHVLVDNTWSFLALGDLQIIYDSNFYGGRIVLKINETGEIVSNTIISLQMKMQVTDNECMWTAIDYALNPPMKRTIKATFASATVADEMYNIFCEGQECAREADISEPADYLLLL